MVDWITNATSRPAGQSRRILACRRPDSTFASAVPRAAHVSDDRIGLIRINGLIGRGEDTYWSDGGKGVCSVELHEHSADVYGDESDDPN